jgi:RNA polymerase sigma-70 factor (ECF subfamily)
LLLALCSKRAGEGVLMFSLGYGGIPPTSPFRRAPATIFDGKILQYRHMDKEDIILIKRAKKDPSQYEALYKKYAQKLFNYFWYRVGHQKDVAEDLMQKTFIKAYEHLPKFNLRAYSYYSYLLTIAHNLLINHYRNPQTISLESVGDIPDEVTQDQILSRREAMGLLWRAIQQLPEKDKDIILLRYQKELPIKDIARIVGKSENAVKLTLSRTRKNLAAHPYLEDMAMYGEYQKKYTKPKFSQKSD